MEHFVWCSMQDASNFVPEGLYWVFSSSFADQEKEGEHKNSGTCVEHLNFGSALAREGKVSCLFAENIVSS